MASGSGFDLVMFVHTSTPHHQSPQRQRLAAARWIPSASSRRQLLWKHNVRLRSRSLLEKRVSARSRA